MTAIPAARQHRPYRAPGVGAGKIEAMTLINCKSCAERRAYFKRQKKRAKERAAVLIATLRNRNKTTDRPKQ